MKKYTTEFNLAVVQSFMAGMRGVTEISKQMGITRAALYKALRPDANPRFETVSKVCAALGVKLMAQPVQAGA